MRSTKLWACTDTYCGKSILGRFYAHRMITELAAEQIDGTDVAQYIVRDMKPGETSIYWAWWDNEEQSFDFVYTDRMFVSACFQYGAEVEEQRGRGQVVHVFVERCK